MKIKIRLQELIFIKLKYIILRMMFLNLSGSFPRKPPAIFQDYREGYRQ